VSLTAVEVQHFGDEHLGRVDGGERKTNMSQSEIEGRRRRRRRREKKTR
jgi:hypothetical protein